MTVYSGGAFADQVSFVGSGRGGHPHGEGGPAGAAAHPRAGLGGPVLEHQPRLFGERRQEEEKEGQEGQEEARERGHHGRRGRSGKLKNSVHRSLIILVNIHTAFFIRSVARFCHGCWLNFRAPAWAVANQSSGQSAMGTFQIMIFKT